MREKSRSAGFVLTSEGQRLLGHVESLEGTLQVACELVLDGNVVTAPVVMNEMRRLISPSQQAMVTVPDMLKLQLEPLADCGRYDHLREVSHVLH